MKAKILTFLKKYWPYVAIVGVALFWGIRAIILNMRRTRLAEAWIKTTSEYTAELQVNQANHAVIKQIEAERAAVTDKFIEQKRAVEDLRNANDQVLADAWNASFGHKLPTGDK